MGEEKNVKKIISKIDELKKIIDKANIDYDLKVQIDKIYEGINETYKDFLENYLDFREIADHLYDGIYISDSEGNTIFVNNAYSRLTGISKEEVMGRNVKEISEEGKLYKRPVTMDVIERKEVVNSVGKSLKNNREFLVTGSPIFDEDGNLKLVVINDRDISELKELQHTITDLQYYKTIADEEIKYLRSQQNSNQLAVYESESMRSILELVKTIAPTNVTVLITGESGTGKEVLADEIHNRSQRANKPFIKVNCSSIPRELLESELFGYEEGAFTGAKKTGKIGLFELANGGTILLDEIGDMPFSLQAKLLRVLQTKEINRIGGTKPISLDVRVIAATNKNLQDEINAGRFREDLYYRLNVVPIELKPLRERKEVIRSLTLEFLAKFNKMYGKNTVIQEEAFTLLENYNWPGNIRELENLIERMVVINMDGIIKYSNIESSLNIENLGGISKMPHMDLPLKEAVGNLEREIIIQSIKKYGSINKAAERLGLSQPALSKKCKSLKIDINKLKN